jgi:hypothetical protein
LGPRSEQIEERFMVARVFVDPDLELLESHGWIF